jgi:hypothetical protein
MSGTNGTEPRVLTTEEREAVLVTKKKGAEQREETKQLMTGVSLFKAGDAYFRNSANLSTRASANGFRSHCRKAVVDGEAGYVVWWDPKEQSDV